MNGYTRINGKCQKDITAYKPVEKLCHEGWVLNNDNVCQKEILTKAATPTCPTDYTLENGYCVRRETEEVLALDLCDAGYTYDAVNLDCRKVYQYAPEITCEEGFAYDSVANNCTKLVSTEVGATTTCPAGSVYGGDASRPNECYELVVSDAKYTCPSNYTYDVDSSLCITTKETTKPANAVCPAGYIETGGECLKVTVGSAQKTCSGTYDDVNEKCYTLEPIEIAPTKLCEGDADYINGECIEKEITIIEGTCTEPGYL
jgi:hypothetical protein